MEYLQAAHGFIAPPPLSPYFKEGGVLYGYNEDVMMTLGVMALLAVLDVCIVRPFMAPKARYFALHAVANTIAAIAAFPDLVRGLFGGLNTFNGPSNTMMANSSIAAIHIYHCVAFPLRAEDIFHHLQFVVILCGLAIPYKHEGGVANNFGCFFLSGVPGGLDYILLCLVAHGVITKMDEKIWNARINAWLRGPSMTVYMVLGWQAWVHNTYGNFHPIFLFVIVFLHFTNGQYYCRQAVESYAVHKERARVAREASKDASPASPLSDDSTAPPKRQSTNQPKRSSSRTRSKNE